MFSENAKGINVAMGSLQRSNPEVSLLVRLVAFWSMMMIIVALLTRLGCFQLLTNNVNLLFCFLDHIRSKELSFIGF